MLSRAAVASDPAQVVALLDRIGGAIRGAHLKFREVQLPDPDPAWFAADPAADWVIGTLVRGAVEGVTAPPIAHGAYQVLRTDHAERLTASPPRLPYRIAARADEYTRGFDVEAKAGLLFYGEDNGPAVVGLRGTGRRKEHGTANTVFYGYGEYLHGVDGGGGIAAGGVGTGADDFLGLEMGVAIPWGSDRRRQHATFPGYTLALHGELRLRYQRQIELGRRTRITLEGSIAGGINLAALAIGIGNAIGDICTRDPCEMSPPSNRLWPFAHWMVTFSVGLGQRSEHEPYADADVFRPAGRR